jgi:hypothetical protein
VTYPVLDVPDDYEAPTRKARAPRAAAKPEGDGGGGGRGEGEYTDNQIKAFKKINRRQLAELHSFYRKAGIESRDVEDRLKKNIDDINNAATKEQFTAVNYAQTQIYKTIADLKPGESAEAEQEEEVPPTTTTEGADEIKEEDTVAAKPDAGKDKRTGKKKVAKRVRRTTAEILGELEDKIGTKLDTTTPAPKIDRTPTVEGTDVESALAREYGETAAERRVRIALESERAMAREYGYKAGEEHLARADQVAREMSAIEAARRAYENRGIIGRFRDWLNPNRTPPPMTLEEYRLQTRTDLTPEAKNLLQAKEAMMLRRFGYRARAAEAGVESRWSWFEKKNFKGAARSIAIGAAVLAALSAAGIATIPAGLVGVVGGSLVGTWAKNVTERMGYKGWKSQVAGFVLGSAAGFGLGSLTNAAINADWSSMFNKVFGGGAESIPVGGGGITAFPADVATPVLSGGESVASNLIEGQGMIQGLPDIGEWGRGAFEDAFRNFVEQRGLKGDLIGQALANTPWERLPNGTAVNFGEFFGNQRNVDGLIRFITSNYPTLAGEMTDAGTNVASYVRGVAQGYTGGR